MTSIRFIWEIIHWPQAFYAAHGSLVNKNFWIRKIEYAEQVGRVEGLRRVFAGDRWKYSDEQIGEIETQDLKGRFRDMVMLRYSWELVSFGKVYQPFWNSNDSTFAMMSCFYKKRLLPMHITPDFLRDNHVHLYSSGRVEKAKKISVYKNSLVQLSRQL